MKAFILFHLNLSFSSVEEHDHKLIIEKCYWPILDLCKNDGIKINIEASASTLFQINAIDPEFLNALKLLIIEEKIEFVGSGYVQAISPISHPLINDLNLKLANKSYKEILGITPTTALVNEMSFAQSNIDAYLNNGFNTIISDVDNVPPDISTKSTLYNYGKISLTNSKEDINIVWSDSILFQNFQRFIHGENTLEDYDNTLESYLNSNIPYIPIYTNDAEVFNYRPGRFTTEKKILENEWEKISKLLTRLAHEKTINLDLIQSITSDVNFPKLALKRITNIENPVLVKKQAKYNINRWALSGRSDQKLNLITNKLANLLANNEFKYSQEDLKKILTFHSSDLRTHITQLRWEKLDQEIKDFFKVNKIYLPKKSRINLKGKISLQDALNDIKNIKLIDNKYLEIKTNFVHLKLNMYKGMCIDRLSFEKHNYHPLIKTFPSGSFNDIKYGVDFFSGNAISESPPLRLKTTDLERVEPYFFVNKEYIKVFTEIDMGLFKLQKEYSISMLEEGLSLRYVFVSPKKFIGSVRLGNFLFDTNYLNDLFVTTNIGSYIDETFSVNKNFDHTHPISHLVSSTTSLPSVFGNLSIHDSDDMGLNFKFDTNYYFAMPMLKYQQLDPQDFLRLTFSIKEMDDTSKPNNELYPFKINITPL